MTRFRRSPRGCIGGRTSEKSRASQPSKAPAISTYCHSSRSSNGGHFATDFDWWRACHPRADLPIQPRRGSGVGGLHAYRIGPVRPLSRPLLPFGQRSLLARLKRPRPRAATSAIRRLQPSASRRARTRAEAAKGPTPTRLAVSAPPPRSGYRRPEAPICAGRAANTPADLYSWGRSAARGPGIIDVLPSGNEFHSAFEKRFA